MGTGWCLWQAGLGKAVRLGSKLGMESSVQTQKHLKVSDPPAMAIPRKQPGLLWVCGAVEDSCEHRRESEKGQGPQCPLGAGPGLQNYQWQFQELIDWGRPWSGCIRSLGFGGTVRFLPSSHPLKLSSGYWVKLKFQLKIHSFRVYSRL